MRAPTRTLLLMAFVTALSACESMSPGSPEHPSDTTATTTHLRTRTEPSIAGGLSRRFEDGARSSNESTGPGVPRGFAFEIVDLATGSVVEAVRPEQLDVDLAPGSLAKVVALLAAAEAGVVDERTRIACPRRLSLEGHQIDCVHPDLGHPLTAAEALAVSCNGYFVSLARRLPRDAFNRTLTRLGLDPLPSSVSLAVAVLGLEGVRASARAWRSAISRAVEWAFDHREAPASRMLLEGLGQASISGTAAPLGDNGLSALAKTGTATLAQGQVGGVVVALVPAERPDLAAVGVVAGASGHDAATLIAGVLAARHRGAAVAGPPHLAPSRSSRVERPGSPGSVAGLRPGARSSDTVRVGRRVDDRLDVSVLSLEDYVARVVQAEAPTAVEPALAESLAILARTFVASHGGRHASEEYDVCDTTHCQVVATEALEVARRAASDTAGLVLASGNDVARVYYSASCPGRLAGAEETWHHADPRANGARTGPDPVVHDLERWTADIPRDALSRALLRTGFRGQRLATVTVVARRTNGSARTLHLAGLVPNEIDAEEFRLTVGRQLGWHLLKSSSFSVSSDASGMHFEGVGKGHGVGLCVAGARVLARRQATASAILSTYFPRLKVTSLAGRWLRAAPSGYDGGEARDDLTVVLPAADVLSRAGVEAEIRDVLGSLRFRLGRVAPLQLTVRVHPSRESYARQTHKPWWTSGTTRVDDDRVVIDLLPMDVLVRRGAWESTLRHELAHAVVDPVLAARPLWAREGLAAHLAGETSDGPLGAGTRTDRVPRARQPVRGAVGDGRAAVGASGDLGCPQDPAFIRPTSPASVGDAYVVAAACVRRALAGGIDWRELGRSATP